MSSDLIKHEDSGSAYAEEGSGQSPINFRQLMQVLREKFWLLLFIASAGGFLVWMQVDSSPVKYQAKAVLQVEQEEPTLIHFEDSSRQDLRATEILNTIVQNIKNSGVMLHVVQTNHLATDPQFRPGSTNHPSEVQLARMLNSMVTAKLRPETRLIDITVSHPNPQMAQKLANSVAREFLHSLQEQRFGTVRLANEFLYQEAAKLKEKLELSERRIQSYKETNHSASIEDRKTILSEKLKELSARSTAAKAERLRTESDLRQVQNVGTTPEALLTLPRVLDDTAIADVRRKVIEQEAVVATLSQRYKPQYPKMVQAQRQLDDLRASMNSLILSVPKAMQANYEGLVAREKSLELAFNEAQKESIELDKKAIDYEVLVRDVQSDRAMYDSVVKRLKEIDLSKGFANATVNIVEAAEVPLLPDKLPPWVFGAATFMALFLGGWGIYYLVRVANSAICTVDEAERLLGLPVWAAIPIAHRSKKRKHAHILVEEPASVCSEGFRTLRTSARIANQQTTGKIHAFTSADPGEGKTFCCVNHALCHAQQGRTTLLIDLDLRKPTVGESFQLAPETPGVTDYLTGRKPLEQCIQSTRYENLHVMPAGPLISNPAEELAKETVLEMLQELSRDYDQIIIDTPPVLAVSDAFLILPLADTICLVVRTGKTPRRIINRALDLMMRANIPPAGIVLNFLPRHSGRGFYYYGVDHRYGRNEVYSSATKKLTNVNQA